jgi:3-deoxy-manno-octulosonate cytidylyltransferase (CMP-KDO synthetase)
MSKVIGIIPARFASTRFPGKPLVMIAGKSLIQRTYESASRCKSLEKLVVATDDKRIFDHVKNFGGHVLMTSPSCLTGTDRLAEVVSQDTNLADDAIIINVQGDEPCVDPKVIEKLAEALTQETTAVASTPIIKLTEEFKAFNPSFVKCVIDQKGFALYFSRHLIPAGMHDSFLPHVNYWKHIGLYGYRKEFLIRYASLKPTPLQLAEDLEMLKILEYGYKIITVQVEEESFEINTPEDLKKMEEILCNKQSTSL